jgi:orotate phosphoribosyltransferase
MLPNENRNGSLSLCEAVPQVFNELQALSDGKGSKFIKLNHVPILAWSDPMTRRFFQIGPGVQGFNVQEKMFECVFLKPRRPVAQALQSATGDRGSSRKLDRNPDWSGGGWTRHTPRTMKEEQVLSILKESNALYEGHFELRSGLHSPNYFQCANVLRYPWHAETLCKALVESLRAGGYLKEKIDAVISPAMGGIVVGHEVARALHVPSIFAEKQDGKLVMRRFTIEKGTRLIVAEDVVTRGGRVQETIDIVTAAGATVVAAALLVNRSGGKHQVQAPLVSLVKLEPVTYEPTDCPLCKKGIPMQHPGS